MPEVKAALERLLAPAYGAFASVMARALTEPVVSGRWDPADLRDKRIVGHSDWCPLDDLSRGFPDAPGIYVLVDAGLRVKYVSASINLRRHANVPQSLMPDDSVDWVGLWAATDSPDAARSLERSLIKKYMASEGRDARSS
jgi:hypothetical protein